MEKLIKIQARMIDGTTKKYRTTKFSVKPFRNTEGAVAKNRLYVNIDNHRAFACKSIEVEQKEIEPALNIATREEAFPQEKQLKYLDALQRKS